MGPGLWRAQSAQDLELGVTHGQDLQPPVQPSVVMLGGSAGLVYGLPVGGVAGQVCCCVPRVQRPPRRRSPTLDAAAVCRSFCQQSSPLDLGFLLDRDVGSQNRT